MCIDTRTGSHHPSLGHNYIGHDDIRAHKYIRHNSLDLCRQDGAARHWQRCVRVDRVGVADVADVADVFGAVVADVERRVLLEQLDPRDAALRRVCLARPRERGDDLCSYGL